MAIHATGSTKPRHASMTLPTP